MAVRNAILIARRDHDDKALSAAYRRGHDLGMSPRTMNAIGRERTDVYLFSRLPDQDQISLLKQASAEEYKLYWPAAHRAVKVEMRARP